MDQWPHRRHGACSSQYTCESLGLGAINNNSLLREDENGVLSPLPGLVCASETQKGHFRLIRESTWNAFADLYPNSGPKIVAVKTHTCPPLSFFATTCWSNQLRVVLAQDPNDRNGTDMWVIEGSPARARQASSRPLSAPMGSGLERPGSS